MPPDARHGRAQQQRQSRNAFLKGWEKYFKVYIHSKSYSKEAKIKAMAKFATIVMTQYLKHRQLFHHELFLKDKMNGIDLYTINNDCSLANVVRPKCKAAEEYIVQKKLNLFKFVCYNDQNVVLEEFIMAFTYTRGNTSCHFNLGNEEVTVNFENLDFKGFIKSLTFNILMVKEFCEKLDPIEGVTKKKFRISSNSGFNFNDDVFQQSSRLSYAENIKSYQMGLTSFGNVGASVTMKTVYLSDEKDYEDANAAAHRQSTKLLMDNAVDDSSEGSVRSNEVRSPVANQQPERSLYSPPVTRGNSQDSQATEYVFTSRNRKSLFDDSQDSSAAPESQRENIDDDQRGNEIVDDNMESQEHYEEPTQDDIEHEEAVQDNIELQETVGRTQMTQRSQRVIQESVYDNMEEVHDENDSQEHINEGSQPVSQPASLRLSDTSLGLNESGVFVPDPNMTRTQAFGVPQSGPLAPSQGKTLVESIEEALGSVSVDSQKNSFPSTLTNPPTVTPSSTQPLKKQKHKASEVKKYWTFSDNLFYMQYANISHVSSQAVSEAVPAVPVASVVPAIVSAPPEVVPAVPVVASAQPAAVSLVPVIPAVGPAVVPSEASKSSESPIVPVVSSDAPSIPVVSSEVPSLPVVTSEAPDLPPAAPIVSGFSSEAPKARSGAPVAKTTRVVPRPTPRLPHGSDGQDQMVLAKYTYTNNALLPVGYNHKYCTDHMFKPSSIHDKQVNDILTYYLYHLPTYDGSERGNIVLRDASIGLMYNIVKHKYEWLDGSKVDYLNFLDPLEPAMAAKREANSYYLITLRSVNNNDIGKWKYALDGIYTTTFVCAKS
ncbi:unnamed protein product [Bursaphelenchus okinawaensis]|uniref:Uncharacterized protein n=1 Tax=Bursaphelenchus okinawaensis TaxID=465554 RepID=A0A811KT34_9BILA|nr:unnamed protein product [Bursaphelenchus okinawaensis]CAG9110443.1 unnamed protein product [Bursaphelenchus okinawaensis]